jgi:hypothetical protein
LVRLKIRKKFRGFTGINRRVFSAGEKIKIFLDGLREKIALPDQYIENRIENAEWLTHPVTIVTGSNL